MMNGFGERNLGRASKIGRDGANFMFGEQLQCRWSNFMVWRATSV